MVHELGSTIYLRHVRDGFISFAWPLVVVGQREETVLAAQLPGAVGMVMPGYYGAAGDGKANPFGLVPHPWRSTRLVLALTRDQWWTTYVFFEEDGPFMGWYVNFQRPFQVRGKYFDTLDLQLDIWVDPDRTWAWKDEDHYASDSRITPDERAAVEIAKSDVLAGIDDGAFPFDDSIIGQPPMGLDLPVLGPDWPVA